jgi:hypothetical protein
MADADGGIGWASVGGTLPTRTMAPRLSARRPCRWAPSRSGGRWQSCRWDRAHPWTLPARTALRFSARRGASSRSGQWHSCHAHPGLVPRRRQATPCSSSRTLSPAGEIDPLKHVAVAEYNQDWSRTPGVMRSYRAGPTRPVPLSSRPDSTVPLTGQAHQPTHISHPACAIGTFRVGWTRRCVTSEKSKNKILFLKLIKMYYSLWLCLYGYI